MKHEKGVGQFIIGTPKIPKMGTLSSKIDWSGYRILYTYHDPQLSPLQEMEVFVTNNAPYILFDLEFYAKPNDFSKYAETFTQMLHSFHIALV